MIDVIYDVIIISVGDGITAAISAKHYIAKLRGLEYI